MNEQYRKNLKAISLASKNYIDTQIQKSEERILSIVARNNVDFIDHINEPTYRFTAPLNSKLLMLQSVAGNSNKIAPSTPSDDSVARLKVIPDNTYKSQIDYIGGKTVKYNQLVQNGNFSDSGTGWLVNATFGTSSVANNKLTYTITTKNASQSIATASGYRADIISGHKYLLSGTFTISQNAIVSFEFDTATTINTFGSVNANTRTTLTTIKEISISTTNKGLYIYPNYGGGGLEVGATAVFENIMLIDLTQMFGAGNEPSDVATAITLLKANGYKLDGTDTYSVGDFKHAVVSGVKYGSKNLMNLLNVNQTTRGGITYKVENNKITFNGTATETLYLEFDLINPISASDDYYSLALFNDKTSSGLYVYGRDLASQGVYNFTGYMSTVNFSKSNFQLVYGLLKFNIRVDSGTTINNFEFTPMLIKGTTAPSTYIPYVAPITKAIPSEVLALDGYGMGINDTLYNYIDLNAKKFIKKVGKILGSSVMILYKNAQSEEDWLYYFSIAGGNGATASNQIICNKLDTKNTAPTGTTTGCSITSSFGGIFYVNLYGLIQTNDVPTALAYIQANLVFIYPLPSVIETDISEYLTTDFKVDLDKQYATCEMVCDEPIDMPNKVEYYGTIIHALATAVKQDGFNVWDETNLENVSGFTKQNGYWVATAIDWDALNLKNYINFIKDQKYTFSFEYIADSGLSNPQLVIEYDDGTRQNVYFVNVVGDRKVITSSKAGIVNAKISYGDGGNNNLRIKDLCINISNQDLNGTYKPYKAPITRLLPNSEAKYSWGITTGVRNVRTYCDDEGNAVNEGSLAVGNQDLGGLNYTYEDSTYHIFSTPIPSNMKAVQLNKLCANYTITSNTNWDRTDKTLSLNGSLIKIIIKDMNFSNATIFKTANNGVPLFYEKNTTDTETLDDFDFSFDCEEGDTFTIIGCELLQCYATYSFLIKEAKSNE